MNEERLQCRKRYICTPRGVLTPVVIMGHCHACAINGTESMLEITERDMGDYAM